jgi:hypothetical protein
MVMTRWFELFSIALLTGALTSCGDKPAAAPAKWTLDVDRLAGAFDIELFKFDFATPQYLEIIADVDGERGSGYQIDVGAGECWVGVQRLKDEGKLKIVWMHSNISSSSNIVDPIGERGFTSYPTPLKVPGSNEFKLMESAEGEPKGMIVLVAKARQTAAP